MTMREARGWLQLVRRELDITVETVVEYDEGWDSRVFELNGEWIARVPRRREIAEALRREVRVLERLRACSLPVPAMRLLERDGLVIGVYPKIEGLPVPAALAEGADETALGERLGFFLALLHGADTDSEGSRRGASVEDWIEDQYRFYERECKARVYPLLTKGERNVADDVFRDFLDALDDGFPLCLVHCDLGPAHILCRGNSIVGIIDWSDAQIGDPAIDFGWALHGAGIPFATTLKAAYQTHGGPGSEELWERALFYHRLGPWYEVLYGVAEGDDQLVKSGLVGIRRRLP